MAKKRVDALLFEQGLLNSRSQAQRVIIAGLVSDYSHRGTDKDGKKLPEGGISYIKDDGKKYVSRGRFKLEEVL